ncbi:MAG: hypothetical protein JKX98_03600 [Alcanivoracaceae bacterium]|nr:hypothetical protein [Alcanivoracaceae bacterium]
MKNYDSLEKLKAKYYSNCQKMKEMGYTGSELSIGEINKFGKDVVSVEID